MSADPNDAVERLSRSERPLLVGIRHHAASCAHAMSAWLDAFAPTRVLVELPTEFSDWLSWLAHPDTVAPVALAASHERNGALFFYPFADFSPELAAIRWAFAKGVPVEPCDLPYRARTEGTRDREALTTDEPTLIRAILGATSTPSVEALWDRLVEAPGAGGDRESLRRAALLFGWALRHDDEQRGTVSAFDLARERFMRGRIRRALAQNDRVAVVVGAYHAPALLDPNTDADDSIETRLGGALIPYAFDLFDSRSGYPAGIRDPLWQQRVRDALRDGRDLGDVVHDVSVAVSRELRRRGHTASVIDAVESSRIALNLASLRGLRAPGRREMLEAVETTMGQGEPLGRGRALARALERVLVGNARGRLASGTPRSGLGPHIEGLIRTLRLPGADAREPEDLFLDPLRSDLDRRRHIALWQMSVCGISYATVENRAQPMPTEALGARWRAQWTPATEAGIEMASVRGVTLEQAARGALLAEEIRARNEDRFGAAAMIRGVVLAAECGLASLTAERMARWPVELLAEASLAEIVAALGTIERITRGHVPGLAVGFTLPEIMRSDDFLAAAVRALEGLAGSDVAEEVKAVGDLVQLVLRQRDLPNALGEGRLGTVVDTIAQAGSDAMQGGASAAAVLLGRLAADTFGVRLGSWIDGAADPDGHTRLAGRLRGALWLATLLFESHGEVMLAIAERIVALDDRGFLARLPALRHGFEALSPAARDRLLATLGELFPDTLDPRRRALDVNLDTEPGLLARAARADAVGHDALLALCIPIAETPRAASATEVSQHVLQAPVGSSLDGPTRFRLVLGRERDRLPPNATRYATALDELYGRGRGEGSRGELGAGQGGGTEPSFPTVREWSGEIEALFGASVRDEVLGRAAATGRVNAALALDADQVTPSVDLLEQLLSLKGALAERDLAKLRGLVKHIVDALVEALARRVRPALAGLVSTRPVRRKVGPLDLRRTVARNLRTARHRGDGGVELVPDDWIFRSRTRRAIDWHVTLVVDVSGSMEPSTIYSALMAAILSSLPAVSVQFFAFSTEVIDLTERVTDPLALLLEVQVGGGTDIGRALRFARSKLKVPSRTIVLVVSDFEEGVSVPVLLAESRALVETGAKVLGLASLDDRGAPRYQRAIAELLADTGMPIAALSPLELARWVADQIR